MKQLYTLLNGLKTLNLSLSGGWVWGGWGVSWGRCLWNATTAPSIPFSFSIALARSKARSFTWTTRQNPRETICIRSYKECENITWKWNKWIFIPTSKAQIRCMIFDEAYLWKYSEWTVIRDALTITHFVLQHILNGLHKFVQWELINCYRNWSDPLFMYLLAPERLVTKKRHDCSWALRWHSKKFGYLKSKAGLLYSHIKWL